MQADSPDSDEALWPAPVASLIEQFAALVTRCRRVLKAWQILQSTYRPRNIDVQDDLPLEVTSFADLEIYKRSRRASSPTSTRLAYFDRVDELTFSVRRWRETLRPAQRALPSVARWMDDAREPAFRRWTAEVRGEFNRLGGQIDELTIGDSPVELDTAAFEALTRAVTGRLSELKRVANVPDAEGDAGQGLRQSPEYLPAREFPKGMAARLRKAASNNRKGKRVATREIDGVVCYSVADVRRWWPSEAPKQS